MSWFNPNPVAGRTYIQANDNYGTKILSNPVYEISYSQVAEYNPNFHQKDDDTQHLANTHLYRMQMTYPFMLVERKFQFNLIERSYIDDYGTGFSAFLLKFHEAVGSTKEIPPQDQSHTYTAGENKVSVIGKKNRLFFVTGDFSIKGKILSARERLPLEVALELSYRQAQSRNRFNTEGYGATVLSSYGIKNSLSLMANLHIGHQNLKKEHFDSKELRVFQNYISLLAGMVYDSYEPGGFYYSFGLRYSTPRVQYRDNLKSAKYSTILHASFNYHAASQGLLYFLELNEDVLDTLSALEPDIMITFGVALFEG